MLCMQDRLIKIFEEVRDIPYRIPLSASEKNVSCSGKAKKLKVLLEQEGYPARYRVCEFRWSDVQNIPTDVHALPHADDSTHVYVEVLIDGIWVKVDPTWDRMLATIFPVAVWDGRHDTRIAVKPIVVYGIEESRQIMEDESADAIEKDLAINSEFYRALNDWLLRVRSQLDDTFEYIIQSDEKGNIIGPIEKNYAHSDGVRAAVTHYSTWSMVYHPRSGTYGIQLKNPTKHDTYTAGKWDMGVAGHNRYVRRGELMEPLSFEENLSKEAQEEIGITLKVCVDLPSFLEKAKKGMSATAFIFDRFLYKTETDNEWIGLGFILVPTQVVIFTDDEVIDFKWLTPDELRDFIATRNDYCSPLPLAFERAEVFRKRYFQTLAPSQKNDILKPITK